MELFSQSQQAPYFLSLILQQYRLLAGQAPAEPPIVALNAVFFITQMLIYLSFKHLLYCSGK